VIAEKWQFGVMVLGFQVGIIQTFVMIVSLVDAIVIIGMWMLIRTIRHSNILVYLKVKKMRTKLIGVILMNKEDHTHVLSISTMKTVGILKIKKKEYVN